MQALLRSSAIVAVLILLAACPLPDKHFTKPVDECTATGTACDGPGGAADCCSAYCDMTSGLCANDPGSCGVASGGSCALDGDCCSMSCVDLKCACTSDGESCSTDADCCGGVCNGTCQPLSPTCKTAGNSCAGHGECCSQFCSEQQCANPSFCMQAGDSCTSDAACCSNTCVKSGGALFGLCAAVPTTSVTCRTYGEVCGDGPTYSSLPACGGDCCSHACVPYGSTNVLICAPPSGCHPLGEQCYEDADCCGGPGYPDSSTQATCVKQTGQAVGRCTAGLSCAPAGAFCRLASSTCNAPTNCCAGNVTQFDTCRADALGVARCTATADIVCTDPSTRAGEPCASDSDCCGLPCVAGACGSACVQQGGACTTSSDCCAGLPCKIAGGSPTGICDATIGCSNYGQTCTQPSDCCNSVACTNGRCAIP